MCHFPDRKTNISHTHTHTTRHTHTLQQGLTLCALLPTPWKSQPFHTEKVVCVIVPHKTHCWYWADSLQAQNEVDLPDRKTKQNRIKQLSFQHTHTHTEQERMYMRGCWGYKHKNVFVIYPFPASRPLSLSLSLSHTHTHTHTQTHTLTHTHFSLLSLSTEPLTTIF